MGKEKKTKNKKVHIENKGITGMGTDYTYYTMNPTEKITAVIAGILIGFIAGQVYFNVAVISVIVSLICAYKAIPIYQGMLQNKRTKELRLQFRDLLESLSNSYTVGMTANRAFHAAYEDMRIEHGANAYITKEMQLICNSHDSRGFEIRECLSDFAQRSGIDDIRNFASVFEISSDLGGDIAKVIRETRDMIGEKIEIEMEIQTAVTEQKGQIDILAVMPFVMVLLTKSLFNIESTTASTIIVKIVALAMFVFAYWLGLKIIDIKV